MPRKSPRQGQGSHDGVDQIDGAVKHPGQGSDSDDESSEHSSSSLTYKDAVNLPAHQTKHLAELVYRFPSINTCFRLIQRNDTNSTGSSLWLSSQVLSSYLLHAYAKVSPKQAAESTRKKVLELGSGTGLLSLLMARIGWQVVATDIPPVLESVLQPNVKAGLFQMVAAGQTTPDQMEVCELDWTVPPENWQRCRETGSPSTEGLPDRTRSTNDQRFDLILTADTIYEPSIVRPLLSTIAHLYRRQCGHSPTVLLALERRDPTHVTEALRIARDEYDLPFKRIPAKRVRRIFDALGDGATWSRDDWDGVEIWKL